MLALTRKTCLLALATLLAGCGALPHIGETEAPDGPPLTPLDASSVPDAVPQPEPVSRYGNPPSYEVFGRRYHVLDSSDGYVQRGIASWYGTKFHGRRTSSGEPYDMYTMTAAHKSLPLPTYAEVINLDNDRRVIVKINDRGPFVGDRLIDLSYAAAVRLGIKANGTGHVEVRAIDPIAWQQQQKLAQQRIEAPASGLYLQIGAFSQAENADRLRSQLNELVPDNGVHIIRNQAGDPPVYRVRIGPLSDRAEADRMNRDLMAQGLDGARVVTD